MSLTLQNLRAVGTGVEPASLLPGQIAFNITDKVLYVGDGSSFKTNFDGTQVAGVAGGGWYAMPMDFASLGDYYVANPLYYGDTPTDQQVLTWSTALNHPIWTSGGGGGGGNQVYVVTNAAVAAASGATTSDKISAAIGVASPDEGDVTIVTGLPDDVYEGLYFFTTEWVKGAAYAYPSASEVIYDNTATGLTPTVQGAIDDLDAAVQSATSIANTANSTANSALSIANAALPKAGGTMTGTIVSQGINVQAGNSIQFLGAGDITFNGGASGTIAGITDLVSSPSSVLAASANAVRLTYDLANAALARSGGTMTGTITFAAGQTFPISGIDISSASQLGVVQVGANINVTAGGVISVDTATTTNPGIVQLNDTTTSTSATEALTANQGYLLQQQINSLTVASNTKLAGSLDCSSGLVDSVTTDGVAAGFSVGSLPPAPAAGNANYYLIVTTGDASYSPPGGGGPYAPQTGDWFLSNGTAWQYLGVGARPSYASTMVAGIVQLATDTDTQAGTNATLAVTPASLQSKLSDSTSTTSSTAIASSTAVKSAYDLANAALPKAGGTMTGDITLSGAGVGIVFNDASTVEAISDSVATTSSVTAASSTAVKSAYDLANTANTTANAALPKAGGTMTGAITFAAGQTFPVSGIQDATTGQKGVVQVGNNIQVSSGTISVNSASTTQAGVVQLNDTVASTSTTQALTANQGYQLQQQINALATATNLTFAGTIDGSTGNMATVTTEGAGVGFAIGSPLPSPSATIDEYFVIVTTAGTMTPPGGVSTAVVVGDWFLASASAWTHIAAGFVAPIASTTTAGLVELATNAEVQAGTNSTNAVVPSALQSKMSDSVSTTSSTTIASSTAVKSAYDLANAAVPKACYTALGALVVGTGSATIGTLPIGTNGQALIVDTTCVVTGGLTWGQAISGYTCIATPFNTALGGNAGDSITSGTSNTVYGYNAGTAITTGSNNTFVGANSGDGLVGGTNNTAVGANSFSGTGNANNTVVGSSAGAALTVGNSNTLIGANAGDLITGGNSIVGVGQGVLGAAVSSAGAVAIGAGAGAALTSGANTTLVGFAAGDSITTGARNTVVGHTAGGAITTGNDNTIVGALVGNVVTGSANTLLGSQSGAALTAGSSNTFVGSCSGCVVTTGVQNVLIGTCAGRGIAGQDNNVAIGFETLIGTLAIGNGGHVAIGTCALRAVTTGLNNLAIGCNAGLLITTGSCNIAIGAGALDSVTTTANNIGIGFNALTTITSGSENLAIGTRSGCAVTTGACNTFVGYQAGCAVTTGNQNTMVGPYVGTAGLSNNVVLSDGASNIRFQANSSGAWSPDGTNYGIAGQILSSAGTGAAPAWTSSLPQVTAPTASTDAGVQGQIASNGTYFYMYTGGRWQRVAWDATVW